MPYQLDAKAQPSRYKGRDMKISAGSLFAILLSISVGAQADSWSINYCKDLTVDDFHGAAKWSFFKRNFQIEEDTPSSLSGAQKGKKVEIAMTAPGQIVIRWVPGFGNTSDTWLKNLKSDMLWKLAGASEQGKWSINWCKDLTVEDFHAVATWSFHKRKYQIEEDSPSSLIGAQKGKKVEIAMTDPGQIVIRWVPGFAHSRDGWLDNLYRDVTWRLTE
jgi:hypothetical protein